MKYALIVLATKAVVQAWDEIPPTVEIAMTQEVITNPFFGWSNGEHAIAKVADDGKVILAMTNDPSYARKGIGR